MAETDRFVYIAAAIAAINGALLYIKKDLALSPSLQEMVVSGVLVGVGVGVASIVGPLYISEMAPPGIRGSVVSFISSPSRAAYEGRRGR